MSRILDRAVWLAYLVAAALIGITWAIRGTSLATAVTMAVAAPTEGP